MKALDKRRPSSAPTPGRSGGRLDELHQSVWGESDGHKPLETLKCNHLTTGIIEKCGPLKR